MTAAVDALEAVRLRQLMDRSVGRADLVVGLIDGPVGSWAFGVLRRSARHPCMSSVRRM
jgi:hypothetical protein